jgi:hypothetical protein
MDKRLLYKTSSSEVPVSEDKLVQPNPGVAYVEETDTVYFNNVKLPQGK